MKIFKRISCFILAFAICFGSALVCLQNKASAASYSGTSQTTGNSFCNYETKTVDGKSYYWGKNIVQNKDGNFDVTIGLNNIQTTKKSTAYKEVTKKVPLDILFLVDGSGSATGVRTNISNHISSLLSSIQSNMGATLWKQSKVRYIFCRQGTIGKLAKLGVLNHSFVGDWHSATDTTSLKNDIDNSKTQSLSVGKFCYDKYKRYYIHQSFDAVKNDNNKKLCVWITDGGGLTSEDVSTISAPSLTEITANKYGCETTMDIFQAKYKLFESENNATELGKNVASYSTITTQQSYTVTNNTGNGYFTNNTTIKDYLNTDYFEYASDLVVSKIPYVNETGNGNEYSELGNSVRGSGFNWNNATTLKTVAQANLPSDGALSYSLSGLGYDASADAPTITTSTSGSKSYSGYRLVLKYTIKTKDNMVLPEGKTPTFLGIKNTDTKTSGIFNAGPNSNSSFTFDTLYLIGAPEEVTIRFHTNLEDGESIVSGTFPENKTIVYNSSDTNQTILSHCDCVLNERTLSFTDNGYKSWSESWSESESITTEVTKSPTLRGWSFVSDSSSYNYYNDNNSISLESFASKNPPITTESSGLTSTQYIDLYAVWDRDIQFYEPQKDDAYFTGWNSSTDCEIESHNIAETLLTNIDLPSEDEKQGEYNGQTVTLDEIIQSDVLYVVFYNIELTKDTILTPVWSRYADIYKQDGTDFLICYPLKEDGTVDYSSPKYDTNLTYTDYINQLNEYVKEHSDTNTVIIYSPYKNIYSKAIINYTTKPNFKTLTDQFLNEYGYTPLIPEGTSVTLPSESDVADTYKAIGFNSSKKGTGDACQFGSSLVLNGNHTLYTMTLDWDTAIDQSLYLPENEVTATTTVRTNLDPSLLTSLVVSSDSDNLEIDTSTQDYSLSSDTATTDDNGFNVWTFTTTGKVKDNSLPLSSLTAKADLTSETNIYYNDDPFETSYTDTISNNAYVNDYKKVVYNTIEVDGNTPTGEVPVDATYYQTYEGNTATVLSGDTLSLEGYVFKGWTTDSTSTEVEYEVGDIINIDDYITEYESENDITAESVKINLYPVFEKESILPDTGSIELIIIIIGIAVVVGTALYLRKKDKKKPKN